MCANFTCLMLWCTAKKDCLTTEWLPWLQETVVTRSLFWYIYSHKQPKPKSYLTTDNPQNSCEQVTTKNDAFVVILLHRLLYLQDYYCMLFDACRCDLFQRCTISGYYIYKIEVAEGLGSFLSGCLMQFAKYTIHNHCPFSLSAARVTPKRAL